MSTAGPSRVNIDDTDLRISYSGSWTAGIGTGGLEFNNTAHISRVAGSTATLNFQGDFIEVYGSVRKRNNPVGTPSPISSYTLEDGSSVTFTPVETDSNHFRTLFFDKRGLTNGNHTLIIQNLVQDDFLFLDYFVVGESGDAPSLGDSTIKTQPPSSNSSSINVGTLVGVVIGTIAITLFAVLVGFFCWRRIRDRQKKGRPMDEETNYVTQEYTQHPNHSSTPGPRPSSSFDTSLTAPRTTTPYNISHSDTNHSPQQGSTPVAATFRPSKMSRVMASSLPYFHRNQGSTQAVIRDSVGQQNSDLSYDPGNPLAPPPYPNRRF